MTCSELNAWRCSGSKALTGVGSMWSRASACRAADGMIHATNKPELLLYRAPTPVSLSRMNRMRARPAASTGRLSVPSPAPAASLCRCATRRQRAEHRSCSGGSSRRRL